MTDVGKAPVNKREAMARALSKRLECVAGACRACHHFTKVSRPETELSHAILGPLANHVACTTAAADILGVARSRFREQAIGAKA